MKPTGRPGRWLIVLPPLLFLLVFFLIPFAFAFKISFAEVAARVPPFTDIFSSSPGGGLQLTLSPANYQYLFTDEVYGYGHHAAAVIRLDAADVLLATSRLHHD